MDIGLWGEAFDIPSDASQTKTILNKLKEPKKEVSNKQVSKNMLLEDKVRVIKENVYKILGKHKEDTKVIYSIDELSRYIDVANSNGIIAVDTETNNSLDPLTCKLMGLCLYTPNEKQAYVPINHVDMYTKELLPNQLVEEDIFNQLNRLNKTTKKIFHNGKFDYEVIKCTCGNDLDIYWDTLIGARLLNENESASLKEQYILHIDGEQEKYSIEKLFEKEEYAIFPPELFALYAATDSYMTYLLYKYQERLFNLEENKKVFKLFKEVEMPCVKVIANMELSGVEIDIEYCNRLALKYHQQLEEMQRDINKELASFKPKIDAWRNTKEANEKSAKKDGKGFTKSKSEQLDENVNIDSPTQLAILIYDVLKIPPVDKSKPRGTGKEELTKISESMEMPFFELLLNYKKLAKLIEAFLDTLPNQANPKTHRIHCNFNQIGADTGRQSCSHPNIQQIPSKNKEIRMMFRANTMKYDDKPLCDDCIVLYKNNEVEVDGKWVKVDELSVGDIVTISDDNGEDTSCAIVGIEKIDDSHTRYRIEDIK